MQTANSTSSAALDETARKSRKAKNKSGNPIKLPSKILAIAADPNAPGSVYVAEAAGTVKRVVLEVCKMLPASKEGTKNARILSDKNLRDRRVKYLKRTDRMLL